MFRKSFRTRLPRSDRVTDIHIVCDYPHPPAKVWRAVTDPAAD